MYAFASGVVRRIGPGLCLCLLVTAAAMAVDAAQTHGAGRSWLQAPVLAILIGTSLRTVWTPACRVQAGIDFSTKTLLEIAVVLLGLSLSAAAVVAAGPWLIGGIAAIVFLAIALSYAIGRLFGLSHKMAVLIACGNSICGNSAIAATAPVIRADGDDVAASIAFTAVLGVAVVLLLPLTLGLLGLDRLQYGIFAGLTVYAVPQVIAATSPIGGVAMQIGTLVKLVRVLMLGPVVLVLSLAHREGDAAKPRGPRLSALVPWFILGFLAMIALRASGTVPGPVLSAAASAADVLTVVAMAGLGLSVDARSVIRAGGQVAAVVVLSLLGLGVISRLFIFWLAAH
jgi:uncharacterized integral membrane protein (TIGR00698 family)